MLGPTVALLLLMILGSLAPGALGLAAGGTLAAKTGLRGADVRIEADPFLDLPRGRLPRVVARLDHVVLGGRLPIRQASVELTDLRLPPASLLGCHAPVLLAPVDARLRLVTGAEELQAALVAAVAEGKLAGLKVGPLGQIALSEPRVVIEPGGRIGLSAVGDRPGKPPLAIAAAFKPAIAADATRLELADLELALGGQRVPPALLRLLAATALPKLSLDAVGLPGRDWRLTALTVDPDAGLAIEARGVIPAGR